MNHPPSVQEKLWNSLSNTFWTVYPCLFSRFILLKESLPELPSQANNNWSTPLLLHWVPTQNLFPHTTTLFPGPRYYKPLPFFLTVKHCIKKLITTDFQYWIPRHQPPPPKSNITFYHQITFLTNRARLQIENSYLCKLARSPIYLLK